MSPEEWSLSITVDLEFLDSAFLFRGRIEGDPPAETRTMGMEGIEFIADLLEQHGCRGTFFVLGEIAAEHPDMVRDLHRRGHEIGSHGYSKSHPDLRELPEEDLHHEILNAKEVLESTIGDSISGYRAPAFAVDDGVLEVVAAADHTYDSSVVPCRRIPGFYGFPDAPRRPFQSGEWCTVTGLTEYPVTTAPYIRLPLSGAWIRLLGRQYALWGLRHRLQQDGYGVIYVHPHELVDIPDYDALPKRIGWRTGRYTRKTIEEIVSTYADVIKPLGAV